MPSLPALRPILFMLLSAALVVAAAQAEALSFLALLWLIPLCLALQGTTNALWAALLAGSCATLFWAGATGWLVHSVTGFTQAAWPLALLLFLLFCLLQAAPYALFGFLYRHFRWHQGRLGPWQAAATLTILVQGFPIPLPASPFHLLSAYPTLAAITAISGLSILIFSCTLLQCSLASAFDTRSRIWRIHLSIALAIVLLLAGYGTHRQQALEREKRSAGASHWITIALVQPNLHREDSVEPLYQLSRQLLEGKPKPDLLVWPELPPAFSVVENRRDRQQTLQIATDYQQAMLVSSGYVYVKRGKTRYRDRYHNAAHLIRNAEVVASYHKQRLVPFFEYLPLPAVQNRLVRWFPGTLRYLPGNSAKPLKLNNTVRIIPLICFEAIFPDIVSPFLEEGGNIIINPVSDAWFGESQGTRLHLALARFRSVEHNLPWVRVSNSGMSVIVEADGQITPGSLAPTNQSVTARHRVFIPQQRTLYSQYGDWLLPLLLALLFCTFVLSLTKKQGRTP